MGIEIITEVDFECVSVIALQPVVAESGRYVWRSIYMNHVLPSPQWSIKGKFVL